MELTISVKGTKYTVEDKKGRTMYSVKKKGFGAGKFILLDASNYHLYSLLQRGDERKPTFSVTHNERAFLEISCKSLFLDPTLDITGKDENYKLASKDHREFDLLKDGEVKGHLKTLMTVNGELQYEFEIDNMIFDDYLVLFVVAVDRTFGEMNKAK